MRESIHFSDKARPARAAATQTPRAPITRPDRRRGHQVASLRQRAKRFVQEQAGVNPACSSGSRARAESRPIRSADSDGRLPGQLSRDGSVDGARCWKLLRVSWVSRAICLVAPLDRRIRHDPCSRARYCSMRAIPARGAHNPSPCPGVRLRPVFTGRFALSDPLGPRFGQFATLQGAGQARRGEAVEAIAAYDPLLLPTYKFILW
jgi:hypothetical protein